MNATAITTAGDPRASKETARLAVRVAELEGEVAGLRLQLDQERKAHAEALERFIGAFTLPTFLVKRP